MVSHYTSLTSSFQITKKEEPSTHGIIIKRLKFGELRETVPFGFRLGGGYGATSFGHPNPGSSHTSRLHHAAQIRPRLDQSLVSEVHRWRSRRYVCPTSALAPKIGPLGLSPKKVGDDITKAAGDWKGLRITVKLTIQSRQPQIEVVPSASALIIKALQEPPRDRKKQENIQYSGNITFDEIVNIARQMRHQSLARELSATIKEILGTPQCVVCSVDGRHPHGIIDDNNTGTGECPAS
ncbi:60S ribosomal protein L12 [Heterocephalus glaber]|uniref:Large ribosomal subunit protein uL11 n=1 Tax=Heterocephalus glaber TaxID=10181 RepID=G5BLS9_HETGA|nr:60S ribosomal protein L12 [Heterocephalus glaber]